jgi:hypothetical protein
VPTLLTKIRLVTNTLIYFYEGVSTKLRPIGSCAKRKYFLSVSLNRFQNDGSEIVHALPSFVSGAALLSPWVVGTVEPVALDLQCKCHKTFLARHYSKLECSSLPSVIDQWPVL